MDNRHLGTVDDILGFLGERVIRHHVQEGKPVTSVAPLTPGKEGALSFATGSSEARLKAIATSSSTVVLMSTEAFEDLPPHQRQRGIAVADPRREFARLVQHLYVIAPKGMVSPHARIDPTASLGAETTVDPGAYIAAGVVVGSSCHVGANAVLLEGTVIGDHTSIGPSTTIGHVGFGYAREDDGSPVLIPHSGGVTVGSNVDIGANTCIDRGTLDDTVIEDHVKIDNLVHIAHNCHVEEGAFVIATAILCGGVRVGPRAWIAPNASVREQLRVGTDAVVGLASTVIRDVPDGATVVGSPARQVEK